MQWLVDHWQYLLGILLFILNEVIAANPNWKSSSLLQLVIGVLTGLQPKPPIEPPK